MPPDHRPKNGSPINLDEYLPVACTGQAPVGPVGNRCGSTLWVPQERLIYGIHRLARADRSHDVQIPAGIALCCFNCGKIQTVLDIEAATK